MRVLFLGDVVASAGRRVIQAFVPELRTRERLDFVIANGENMAGGLGIDEKGSLELFNSGVDLITGGNHSWDKKEIIDFMARERRILRPANHPEHPNFPIPGAGHIILESTGKRLGVINAMGRIHMDPMDCPFHVSDSLLSYFHSEKVKCILVDIHAEATSEKQAFAHFMAGRVSAVLGSHTHVQTSDERIIRGANNRKTAYITDAGMTGPYDSVIGMKKERSIAKFVSKMPQKYEAAEGMPGLHGVIVEVDDASGEAISIKRVARFLEN